MKNLIYAIFILLIGCSEQKTSWVALQPYKGFEKNLADSVSFALEKNFHVEVIILPEKEIPKETFINVKTPRYRADKLLKILKSEKPDTIGYIMGLMGKDISDTKRTFFGTVKEPASKYEDWGIFGLGYQPGSSCIISTHRLYHAERSKFIDRVQKVAIHELGHNFGLSHCKSPNCVMRDAVETIKTIDHIKPELCDHCKRSIN